MSENQPSRRKPTKKAPSLAPLYGAVLIAILAIVAVAVAQNDKKKRDDAASVEKPKEKVANPFDEALNKPNAGGGSSTGNPSPEGLLSEAAWIKAMATGEQGMAKLKTAHDAEDAGDRAKYKKLAVEARDLLDKALDDTAEWEMKIVEAHGEKDARVAKVLTQRNLWNLARKKLRKVDVNDL